MGYDIDRFVAPINEGLLCCICRDVLEDPVQSPCEHAYCKTCIEAWLVHETRCPEDRKPLALSNLKPLFRYMKNDLNQLQIKCVNCIVGCNHVSSLEFVANHELSCDYGEMECPNDRCHVSITRKDISQHLSVCEFRTKDCPNGCGLTMITPEDSNHSCIAELKTCIDILRSEMATKAEEQRHEMELRLNMQRGHMVQKQAGMQSQIEELQSEMSKLTQKMKLMMDLEIQRRQDLERMALEKRELMELLKGTAKENSDSGSKSGSRVSSASSYRGKVTTL